MPSSLALVRRRSIAASTASAATLAALALAWPASDAWRADAAAQRHGGEPAEVRLISTRFGRMLGDDRRFALYAFTSDRRVDGKRRSRCYGDCAEAWPPLLTDGKPRAGKALKRRRLGTVRRRDGTRQVTYRGRPLYYYVGDTEPKQVLCNDVQEFGGRWFVVRRSGALG